MVRERHGRGMLCVNQTRPHCVNQMGKTHSKPLATRHGRGTAWARYAMRESALRLKLEVTLRFLASGDSVSSLDLFRIPPCTISRFLPETPQSIIFQENIGPLKPRKFRSINIVSSCSTSLFLFFNLRKLLPVHVFYTFYLLSQNLHTFNSHIPF